MKPYLHLLIPVCALLAACASQPNDTTGDSSASLPDDTTIDAIVPDETTIDAIVPDETTIDAIVPDSEDSDSPSNPCEAPLVRLQTGQGSDCAGGNEHFWPLGLDASDCHGWSASDNSGKTHENSASAIGCNADGTFSFTQHAGNLDCSGTGVTKTYSPNVCQQDIPPKLYTMAGDLICCSAPESAECLTGVPSVSVPGGVVYLNGELCTSS
jgi:hypothetical protein